MAFIKISDLGVVSSESLAAGKELVFPVVQSGGNLQCTLSTLLNNINSQNNIRFNTKKSSINFSIGSANTESLFLVDGANNVIGINTTTPDTSVKLHVGGNFRIDGVYVTSVEQITVGSGVALSLTTEISNLADPATNATVTLGRGTNGQLKTITWIRDTSSALTMTVSFVDTFLVGSEPPDNVQHSKIVFQHVGQSVTLIYNSGSWTCISSNNAGQFADGTKILFTYSA